MMQAEQQSEREADALMIAGWLESGGGHGVPSMHAIRAARELRRQHAEIAALSHPSTAQGWKLVPVEPTNEMVFDGAQLDGVLSYDLALAVYRAMLDAAPPPPEQGGKP